MAEAGIDFKPSDRPIPVSCTQLYDAEGVQHWGGITSSNSIEVNKRLTYFCGDPNLGPYCDVTVTHELGHMLAGTNNEIYQEYVRKFRCIQNPNNNNEVTLMEEQPATTYGKKSCEELFADTFAAYKFGSCNMKERLPLQYEWYKNIYNGKEFCDASFKPCADRTKTYCLQQALCTWTGSRCIDAP